MKDRTPSFAYVAVVVVAIAVVVVAVAFAVVAIVVVVVVAAAAKKLTETIITLMICGRISRHYSHLHSFHADSPGISGIVKEKLWS